MKVGQNPSNMGDICEWSEPRCFIAVTPFSFINTWYLSNGRSGSCWNVRTEAVMSHGQSFILHVTYKVRDRHDAEILTGVQINHRSGQIVDLPLIYRLKTNRRLHDDDHDDDVYLLKRPYQQSHWKALYNKIHYAERYNEYVINIEKQSLKKCVFRRDLKIPRMTSNTPRADVLYISLWALRHVDMNCNTSRCDP